jgi:hypothetical protein
MIAVEDRGAPTTPMGLAFGGCAGNVIGGDVGALACPSPTLLTALTLN